VLQAATHPTSPHGNRSAPRKCAMTRDLKQNVDLWQTSSLYSLHRMMGLPVYTFRRVLLLATCIMGVFQYGMVLTNGVSADDFNTYYELTTTQGETLYTCLNFGACALSFIPGLCYDRFGCVPTIILGLAIFNCGVVLQLAWTRGFPEWLSTMEGLMFCYLCFGFACTFFNVIGSFAPLVAFPVKDVGKVSACVQVSMSLGITVQSQAYYWLKGLGGDVVQNYLIYALVCTNVTGALMCIVFWSARGLLNGSQQEPSSKSSEALPARCEDQCTTSDDSELSAAATPAPSLRRMLVSTEFIFMNLLFFVAVGFAFSFLEVEQEIASEVGVESRSLTDVFGVLNALGRLSVSIPLDYTRTHPWGGVFSYITVSLMIFMCGVMILAFPYSTLAAQQTAMLAANAVVAYGYGGLLGIVPPALRFLFGTEHLGLLYGILYVGVSISVPLWTLIFSKSDACAGLGCYRSYYLCCVAGFAAVLALAAAMAVRDCRAKRATLEVRDACQPLLP